jgi:hypothetical protein
MTWVFDSFLGWISKTLASALDVAAKAFLGALGCDLSTFDRYFPFAGQTYNCFLYFALGLLFLIWIFQVLRSMMGPLSDAENPIALTVKMILFFFLTLFSKDIFMVALNIAATPYSWIYNQSVSLDNINQNAPSFTQMMESATGVGFTGLLLVIFLLMIGWNFFKILLEAAERYVIVGILAYTSPLAFCTGASKSTNNIFKGWCRMVASQLFLLIMNVWFIKIIISAFGAVGFTLGTIKTNSNVLTDSGSMIIWSICMLAMMKAAQKMDSYMASMGMTVAQTGTSMLDIIASTAAGARMLTSGFGRKGGGGGGGGGSGTNSMAKGGKLGTVMGQFANKFRPSTYAADAVTAGGSLQGFRNLGGSISRLAAGSAFKHSLGQSGLGGSLATNTISKIAHGNTAQTGMMKDNAKSNLASRSLSHFMPSMGSAGSLQDVTITGGQISGKMLDPDSGGYNNFSLYDANMHHAPTNGNYDAVTASDGSNWYRQMAQSGPSSTATDSETYSHFSSGGEKWYQKTGDSTTIRHNPDSGSSRQTPPTRFK